MSKMINLQNYEAFYLDYLEGNLDGASTAELLLFLDNNPSLKSELEDMDMIHLQPEMDQTFDKQALQKHIDEGNVDDYIISALENEISPEDATDLSAYLISSPAAQQLATRYEKTILHPPELIYPDKEKLKRRGTILYYMIPAISAAAVVLIFLLINPTTGPDDLPISFDPEKKSEIEAPSPNANPAEIAEVNKVEGVQVSEIENNLVESSPNQITIAKQTDPAIESPSAEKRKQPVQQEESPAFVPKQEVEVLVAEENNTPKKIIPGTKPQVQIPEEVVEAKPNEKNKLPLESEKEEEPAIAVIEKQKVDGVETGKQEDIVDVAEVVADNGDVQTTDEYLRIGQLVNRGIRKRVLNEPSPSTDRVQGNELMAAVANGIDKKVKRKVNYKYKKDKKKKSFALTIGNFEFSRTKSD